MGIKDRLLHAWSVFTNKSPTDYGYSSGTNYASHPSRHRFRGSNERTIIASIYTKIAVDAAAQSIRHVRLNNLGHYQEDIDSGLNRCLTLSANLDQTGQALIQDMVQTLLEEGVIAIVPVDTTIDPTETGSYSIKTLRVGKIVEFKHDKVSVRLYDENDGENKLVWVPKSFTAVVENPFYSVMNETNSTLQRLLRKLNTLDMIDSENGAGKLDIIIQLPYTIKSDARALQAEKRRKDLEFQLSQSKYGIGYSDATEKITQLNRPVENGIREEIKDLMEQLYAQLGISQEILSNKADEVALNNYMNGTVDPIMSAIAAEMSRKFLTQTALTQGQRVRVFIDPFKFMSLTQLAAIVDVFSRNQITAPNEIRSTLGIVPSTDPDANSTRNKNMPVPETGQLPQGATQQTKEDQNGT